jgi:hypothetical protein
MGSVVVVVSAGASVVVVVSAGASVVVVVSLSPPSDDEHAAATRATLALWEAGDPWPFLPGSGIEPGIPHKELPILLPIYLVDH